jgi:hypothetical protein
MTLLLLTYSPAGEEHEFECDGCGEVLHEVQCGKVIWGRHDGYPYATCNLCLAEEERHWTASWRAITLRALPEMDRLSARGLDILHVSTYHAKICLGIAQEYLEEQ